MDDQSADETSYDQLCDMHPSRRVTRTSYWPIIVIFMVLVLVEKRLIHRADFWK